MIYVALNLQGEIWIVVDGSNEKENVSFYINHPVEHPFEFTVGNIFGSSYVVVNASIMEILSVI